MNVLRKASKCNKSFAQLLGSLVSACPALKYDPLYTKQFERIKYPALKVVHQDHNRSMPIPICLAEDFDWWAKQLPVAVNYMKKNSFQLERYSDTSTYR